MKGDARKAMPALIQALRHDSDLSFRMNAAYAIGEIDPGAQEVIPALLEAFKEGDPNLRRVAGEVLGKVAPQVLKHLDPELAENMGIP
jgi:HEAT repeat protein